MGRTGWVVGAGCILCVGCARPVANCDPFAKPAPGPEIRQLERFCGEWAGNWAIVSPARATIARFLPERYKPIPATFAGESKGEFVLGGMYLQRSGWYEMLGNQKINFVELTTWDAKARRYRSWFFTDTGERHHGWMKPAADGRSYRARFTGHDRDGHAHSGRASVNCLDGDTVEWRFTARGMTLQGVDQRKK